MQLRPYQIAAIEEIYKRWEIGNKNVLVQLPTGAGKTVIFCNILAAHQGYSIAIAHRFELVSQISLTLARYGIRHGIIAPQSSRREIISLHLSELGKSFFDSQSKCVVAGVDTLMMMPEDTDWFKRVTLVVQDEGHHPLKHNKWGKVSKFFPQARGLYPTATPCRADGQGLGRHHDGIMDTIVTGPPMRELIKMGFLTDYRIFAPPSDINLLNVPVTKSGDYSPKKLRTATHASHIIGDVVSHYLKIAPGKLGVTFCVDISAATQTALEFRARGVSAEVITSNTPALLRAQIMDRFRKRQILQLVNVDLLGEGVDVPAIEVVSMARATQSFAVYSQQFGRALRPMKDKTHAIVIDHVNNVLRHGLPDTPREWSLDRRQKKSKALDVISLKTCIECLSVYSRAQRECPFCGHYTPPTERGAPEYVDGDLLELDQDTLARLRGEIAKVDGIPRIPQGLGVPAQLAIAKHHQTRQNAQYELRKAIALWAGYMNARGKTDSEIYREFYLTFQIDIATAQTLGTNQAEDLECKIKLAIDELSKKG